MEKKEFKKITTEVFLEYGFVKKGKSYYLDLDEVLICAEFSHRFDATYLAYNFSIKAIHSEDERQPGDMFEGYDSSEISIDFDKTASRPRRREIPYKDLAEDYYRDKLREILRDNFDPYRKDALQHIRKAHEISGYLRYRDIIPLSIKAQIYFGYRDS